MSGSRHRNLIELLRNSLPQVIQGVRLAANAMSDIIAQLRIRIAGDAFGCAVDGEDMRDHAEQNSGVYTKNGQQHCDEQSKGNPSLDRS